MCFDLRMGVTVNPRQSNLLNFRIPFFAEYFVFRISNCRLLTVEAVCTAGKRFYFYFVRCLFRGSTHCVEP